MCGKNLSDTRYGKTRLPTEFLREKRKKKLTEDRDIRYNEGRISWSRAGSPPMWQRERACFQEDGRPSGQAEEVDRSPSGLLLSRESRLKFR